MTPDQLQHRREYQRKRGARIAAKFAEREREPLRVIAIWPKKKIYPWQKKETVSGGKQ